MNLTGWWLIWKNLGVVKCSGDAEAIKLEIERISKASDEFAARRMNSGIRKALSGHKIDEFKES